LGLVFLFFVFNANAQLSPVDPHPTPVGFACEPTPFDDEPCIESQCDDMQRPRITTHPVRPVNIFNPARLNIFDWRTAAYPILADPAIPSPLSSPFYQGDNGNIEAFTHTDKQDMRPEDGWEVLKYDFGGQLSAEGISTNIVNVPYIVLYNRFLSKLRVFVARGSSAYETNYCDITVTLTGNNKSSVLDLHHGYLRALDKPFRVGELRGGARVLNVAGKWSYAEFSMIYDPCTCEYKDNSLLITVNNVSVSTINLLGTIQGTLVSNNRSSVSASSESDALSWSDLSKYGTTYVKSYNIVNKFIDDSKKIIDNTRGVGNDSINVAGKKEALNQLGAILNSTDRVARVLRGGLQAVPYITAALSIYDMFTAGGTSSGPQKVAIMPMALNASVKLSGTIERKTAYTDITLATPGSLTSNVLQKNYPYYNETLGVFNLLETPKVSKNLDYRWERGNQEWDFDSYKFSYKLATPVKYVINPASGLEVQDVQAAFVLRARSVVTSSTFDNIISTDMATTKHVNLLREAPQAELMTVQMTEYMSQIIDKDNIWLQLILNLRRKDGKGANVLLVVTYPTTLIEGTTECKDCFQQSTKSEVRKFCTDPTSVYRENRILAKEKPAENLMQPTIQRFKAFPNPVDNLLHINFDSETEQTVKAWLTDVTGRVVSAILEQKTGKGNYNLDLPTQDLPEGLHLLVFEVNGIKKVQKVVIRH
jgi:Secretion system C-terminal sorting domain